MRDVLLSRSMNIEEGSGSMNGTRRKVSDCDDRLVVQARAANTVLSVAARIRPEASVPDRCPIHK